MEQYDRIGTRYAEMKEGSAFCAADRFTLLEAVETHGAGPEGGALDLACGHGDITRLLAARGSAPVVGVDISPEMIRLARRVEEREPLGIEYRVGDAAELPELGRFGVATASYLFNYAPTRAVLRTMFERIRANLAAGGTLLALVPNAGRFLDAGQGAVDARLVERVEGGEAPLMRMEFLTDPPVPFAYYQWEPEDYERAARAAGFSAVRRQPTRTPPPDERWDADFWHAYRQAPRSTLLVCDR
ncbi:class I SAM-dependent methyltransferase [Streptomyces boncukensis]|uniref:Class I SAM-dependent methyltransferase n=1 Tax=Streptomyces boncukensis TaxID=2711219 RepID=A0A6G4WZX2_9ACTN|nr:class I SAM-dependent methyltransferase [Streptomyces boncukensis]NGO70054.1 class I SAM-dependent methyltransferase [Streptomyces boncukensis]